MTVYHLESCDQVRTVAVGVGQVRQRSDLQLEVLVDFAALEGSFVDDAEVLGDTGHGGADAHAEVQAHVGADVGVVDADEQDGFAFI